MKAPRFIISRDAFIIVDGDGNTKSFPFTQDETVVQFHFGHQPAALHMHSREDYIELYPITELCDLRVAKEKFGAVIDPAGSSN